MADNKAKSRQSNKHAKKYDARKYITERNKARRAKKLIKTMEKRRNPERVARLEAARRARQAARKAERRAKIKDFRKTPPTPIPPTFATISIQEHNEEKENQVAVGA